MTALAMLFTCNPAGHTIWAESAKTESGKDLRGGIYTAFGNYYDQPSGLFVEGGEISGNEASTDGGGIFTTSHKVCSISGAAQEGVRNAPESPADDTAIPPISNGADQNATSPAETKNGGSNVAITIPKIALKAAKAGKGKVTVTWKKAPGAAKITGYQIQARVNGSARWKIKNIHVKKAAGAFTGLKIAKRYQVRIRAYRSVNGSTRYGSWSNVLVSGKVK